jgi:hypothetical protein
LRQKDSPGSRINQHFCKFLTVPDFHQIGGTVRFDINKAAARHAIGCGYMRPGFDQSNAASRVIFDFGFIAPVDKAYGGGQGDNACSAR